MKVEIDLDLIDEMAECIVCCSLSVDEAARYMKACIFESADLVETELPPNDI